VTVDAMSSPLRIAWLEVPHPGLGYYDAIRAPLQSLGHNVSLMRSRSLHGFGAQELSSRLFGTDVAFLGFGWFPMERGALPRLQEFERNRTAHASAAKTLCGTVPLVVLINKEYALLQQKLAWLRAHCVDAALSVHHDVTLYQQQTQVPFHRIWFGVDIEKFSHPPPNGDRQSGTVPPHEAYAFDLGFTGVVRPDQTANWRYRIWKQAWPTLSKRGLRLFSGPQGGVHVGVAHAELNSTEYVRAMRASKMWLSTTGPSDLVGTRFFEVMATGVTLCVCNRMDDDRIYSSLGIKEHKHVVMFSSLPEFVEVVTNFSSPEYEARRLEIVRHAQELALRKFSWLHVAKRVDSVLRKAVATGRHIKHAKS